MSSWMQLDITLDMHSPQLATRSCKYTFLDMPLDIRVAILLQY
jgi:hypothetical protein